MKCTACNLTELNEDEVMRDTSHKTGEDICPECANKEIEEEWEEMKRVRNESTPRL